MTDRLPTAILATRERTLTYSAALIERQLQELRRAAQGADERQIAFSKGELAVDERPHPHIMGTTSLEDAVMQATEKASMIATLREMAASEADRA